MTGQAVGIVLAAGAGRRFGSAKALALLDGRRLVDRAVQTLREGGCADVLAVAGAVPLRDVDARVVTNVNWPTGMASSLRVGLTAAQAGPWTTAVLLLVDQPWIGADAVRRLLEAMPDGGTCAQATYGGLPGHPVAFARSTWADVAGAARGDQGARVWLRTHPQDVDLVDCDGTGHPRDVDRPEDLLGT
ncbi:nucleotidyltransferase family protein [Angustibacter sp. McL0619]|uniref:nucleotidyltransferase family protein n=1 Tax=Angustibacter sp. McL0619 TaxID=3415676 RepID=UPI003CF086F8